MTSSEMAAVVLDLDLDSVKSRNIKKIMQVHISSNGLLLYFLLDSVTRDPQA